MTTIYKEYKNQKQWTGQRHVRGSFLNFGAFFDTRLHKFRKLRFDGNHVGCWDDGIHFGIVPFFGSGSA